MESSEETPNWIPTFPETSEAGDSVGSFQSAPVDQPSDDQSFDAISRQKLNLVEQTTPPKSHPAPAPPISMFEEDTRSSWSVEPPKQPVGDCQNSLGSPLESTPMQPFKEVLQEPEKHPEDESLDTAFPKHHEEKAPSPFSKEASQEDSSQISSSPKPPTEDLQTNGFVTSQEEQSQPDVFLNPQEEESKPNDSFLNPSEEQFQSNDEFLNPQEEQSQPSDVFLNMHEEQSQPSDVFLNTPEEKSQSTDMFLDSREDQSQPNIAFNPQEEDSQPNDVFLTPQEEQSLDGKTESRPNDTFINQEEQSLDGGTESRPNDMFLNPQEEPSQDGVNPLEPQTNDMKPNEEAIKEAVSQETPMEGDTEKKLEDEPRAFPPEKLFEYPWPQEQEGAELFMLQEQICEYLGMKSFRRKTMARRAVELEEREFLREKGVVTEVQCDLGLTALRSEEVLELMSKEYPEHYADYIKVLRERELQKHREYAAANSDKTKMVDLVRRAVQSAAEYNAHLNQERREERKSCMDLQTFTIHYPKSNKPKPEVSTKPGKYPVALLPGQFQDYYKEYSPDELKYLPVNTVLYGPLKELQGGEEVSSESEESSASDGSCCSSGDEDSSSESEEKAEEPEYKPKVKPNATCKVCKKGSSDPNAKDELVHCADCDNSAHPACIELSPDVVTVLRTYPWQCTDCKVCSQCTDPNDEDKMLFCDTCDRGFHTFCVGLKQLPAGKWVCRKCGTCDGCGATRPGEKASQWLCEAGEKEGKPRILCQACSKRKR